MSEHTKGSFTLRELMAHDFGQFSWNLRKAIVDPWPHTDHWSSARRFLWSCLSRPYWYWRTKRAPPASESNGEGD